MAKRASQGLSIDRTVHVPLPDGALTVVYRFSGELAARHRPLIDRLNRTGDRRLVERLSLDLVKSWDITDRGRAVPVTRADLARRAVPTAAVALDIPARNPVLARVRQGETVRLWSASTDAVYDLDIYGRAYQPNRGVVTITGTATVVAN